MLKNICVEIAVGCDLTQQAAKRPTVTAVQSLPPSSGIRERNGKKM